MIVDTYIFKENDNSFYYQFLEQTKNKSSKSTYCLVSGHVYNELLLNLTGLDQRYWTCVSEELNFYLAILSAGYFIKVRVNKMLNNYTMEIYYDS